MTGTYFYETQKNQYYFITVVLVLYAIFKKIKIDRLRGTN
jgi:hypothetical protein